METTVRARPTRYRPQPRALSLSLALVLCLFASACGGSSSIAAPSDLLTRGVLTVGSDTTYPPMEYLDASSHQATGFDVDLITAIAKRLGLKTRIVSDSFKPLLGDLAARHFDVAISSITITPQRQQYTDFVPYLNVGQSLLVAQGNPRHIASTDDLCGQAVGVEADTLEQGVLQSASDNCVEQDKPAITIDAPGDQGAVIQLLQSGQVVATYQDSTVTDYYAKQDPTHLQSTGSSVFPAPEGIAIRKGDSSMQRAIQSAFQQVKASGDYDKIARKWGLQAEELPGG